MNRKIVFCILSIICVAVLSMASCSLGKTVTQTVASTTVTQWTSAVTQTATVVNSVTTTLPGAVTTITSPPVTTTVVETTTITAPPVTTTTTSIVTSPPVTTTVTVTPTTTTQVLTAAEAIEVSIQKLTGEPLLEITSGTTQTYFLILSYNNTANKQYTNVKFLISFYVFGLSFSDPSADMDLTSIGGTPLWWWVGTVGSVYNFQSVNGITIPANDSGEIILSYSITYTGTGTIYPQVVVL